MTIPAACFALPGFVIDALFRDIRATEGYELAVDLPSQSITKPDGSALAFDIDPFLKERLLNGWDQIGLTLRHEDKIAAFEKARHSLKRVPVR